MPIIEEMKNTCVLFLETASYGTFNKVFDGLSATERAVNFARDLFPGKVKVLVSTEDEKSFLEFKDVESCSQSNWTNLQVIEALVKAGEDSSADNVVLGYADCPFYNKALTQELVDNHEKYSCEYTYAEGYPAGLVPEIINLGTLKILCELLKTSAQSLSEKTFGKESLFEIIKTDINSFEVECIISDFDFRMWRYDFSTWTKQNFMACQALYEACKNVSELSSEDLHEVLKKACVSPKILKTVPAYYNLQLCAKEDCNPIYSPYSMVTKDKWNCLPSEAALVMETQKVFGLVDEISKVSDSAVINLSMWGECLYHPDLLKIVEKILSNPKLSVFMETNGLLWDDNKISELKAVVDKAPDRTNKLDKIMISVCLDAFTPAMYEKIRGISGGFEKAVDTLKKLSAAFPSAVFPQYVRMNENESELESFFRYWSNKENESGGNLIIQKYDNFAGLLPESKPADLSPVERNVCWHLRRDMNILADGSVPLCRTFLSQSVGNVFEEGVEAVWKKFDGELAAHIKGSPCEKCGKCDEYYTFNF